ncbi:MAG: Crp/Fnr family transcriptional regulator [Myxococcales bacterium]|nr:cyclic nucleotide-binding domain-containing protein [Myxococcales bacterium]
MFAFVTSERFKVLDQKDRDRLEALSKLDEFKAGEEILVSGHTGEWLYLIASGGVDIRARGVTLAQLGPGDIFGELETFAELPPESIRHVARVDTIVRAINKHPLKQEMKTHRSLASGLLAVFCRSISEKVRAANDVAIKLGPAPVSTPPGRPAHLNQEEAAWLAVLGQKLSADAGEVVVAEGDTSRSFYVIEKGDMEVRKRAANEERTLATLGTRDMFGFMAFVDGKPRSASVVAVKPCDLAKIEPDVLEKATHLNFTVSFKFLGTLCSVLGRTYRDTATSILARA